MTENRKRALPALETSFAKKLCLGQVPLPASSSPFILGSLLEQYVKDWKSGETSEADMRHDIEVQMTQLSGHRLCSVRDKHIIDIMHRHGLYFSCACGRRLVVWAQHVEWEAMIQEIKLASGKLTETKCCGTEDKPDDTFFCQYIS